MILIITDAFDTHADAVVSHLTEIHSEYFRLDLDVDSLKTTTITYNNDEWTVVQKGRALHLHIVSCIWARRLTVSLNLEQQNEIDAGFKIWRTEWNKALYGLYSHLRDRFWMNPIGPSNLIENKFFQMRRAADNGFSVPPYVSSNDPSNLKAFAKQHGSVAIKFMAQEIYKDDDGEFKGIYVNRLTDEDLSSFALTGENPIVLQKYIEKSYEVRYTFVDGSHFACKIESQKSSIANTDWRRYDIANTPHCIINPPAEIASKVDCFMEKANLYFGAFDFIVDKNNKWWYLEVNTAGQWLWIEDLAGAEISLTVARRLKSRSIRSETR